jgi:hypothetical protein
MLTLTPARFMGKSDDLERNRTQKVARNFLDRSPYRLFHKYHVDVLKCLADNVFSLQ